MPEANATYYTFNVGGSYKWKYDGRGYASGEFYGALTIPERRAQMLRDNDGKCPGLSTSGSGYIIVVIGDEDIGHGWPMMLHP